MKTLITGACGFVGSRLGVYLHSKGWQVLATGRAENSCANSRIVPYQKLDLLDTEAIKKTLAEFCPDVIYHLAAVSFGPEVENNFEIGLRANVLATENLLSAIKQARPPAKVVFASSGEVYGKVDPKELPITENTPVRPAGKYGVTKIMAESLIQRYVNYEGLNAVILRLFNHTGAGQSDKFVLPSFASQLAKIARKEQEPVIKVGNLSARRDFTSVNDVLRAYEISASKGLGIYNICSGRSYEIGELLTGLIKTSGLQVEVVVDHARFRPIDAPDIYGSYQKAKQQLGWQPEIGIERILSDIWFGVWAE